ncbi:MAG: hypothetical protein LBU35_02980 [Holosporales bacterium]|jgi:AAA family ATP:ADP antiporter|nr:hypothetical protein [Holosporales bacterium]
MIKLLIKFCKFSFGEFEEQELRKFIRLGFILFMLVGNYWIVQSLRDSAFIRLVGGAYIPYAKMVSVLLIIPLIGFYTYLIGRHSKEKLFATIPLVYGIITLGLAMLVFICEAKIYSAPIGTSIIAYSWFFWGDSWGVLLITHFWGIVTDSATPQSARRGIPFIFLIGQSGGIFLPYPVVGLSNRFGFETDLLSMIILGILMLAVIPLVKHFFKTTPDQLLAGFESGEEKKREKEEISNKKPNFTDGIKLILSQKYLCCIFIFGFIIEFLLTTFDFSFKLKASEVFSGIELSDYFGLYSSSLNIISTALLFIGVTNIPRFMGLKVALLFMPLLWGFSLFLFLTFDSLTLLFVLMAGGKAIKFALNNPTLKQLYIPTSTSARYKAQAWIDAFESRLSKGASSLFCMLLKPLQTAFGGATGMAYYLTLIGIVGFPLIVVLAIIAVYLGKTYKKAIAEKKVVC